ncbi:ribonuclease R family protein [Hahella sp. HN01]|uniref:ribonuclease R family protein n=1 Tax=Hahella sp. HN01 TaxID=2847262 RepID=UPI001C1F00A3|nr:VacB/RNase II family 3'-5' exoribonuclease [Hahella sp. HN01]MBU6950941.1 VacB/RNase II family 3'-5' exoribonuclease [Hahella sp. HN01]
MLNSDALTQLKQFKQDLRIANNRFEGTVKGSPGRFGFAVLDDGRECFLNPDEMQKVFPGDRILVEVSQDDKGRDVAKVVQHMRSELKYFVGRYFTRGQGHFVEPDLMGMNRWIFIPPKKRQQAHVNDLVLCRVLQHPFPEGKPQAEVVKIIGKPGASGLEVNYMLAKYNLQAHNRASINEAELQKQVAAELEKRKDLRETPFVTIDAASTQDMDDALFATAKPEGGWELLAAIADPSSLIPEGGDIDKYAQRLGSSFYFADRTLPMLPAKLANHFCSLKSGEDRLALVCTMQIDADGAISSYTIEEASIRCAANLAYEEVAIALASGDASAHAHGATLQALNEVRTALASHRREHALVNEDRPDYQLELDENGKVKNIHRKINSVAHSIVEEAMVASNRCAADFLKQNTERSLYTAHSGFRPERLDQIKQIVSEQISDYDCSDLHTWEGFKKFMDFLDANPPEVPVKAIANRLLARGALSDQPCPHFGMGLPHYTTFTSPIRKYVDLSIHRQIKGVLKNQKPHTLNDKAIQQLQESLRAGRSAVNESETWLKCEYAQTLIGKTFDGVVQHTTGSGFQARLDENGIEGMVNLGALQEKFRFDGTYFQHTGEHRQFRLEQPVKVTISAVDMEKKLIQMELAEPTPVAQPVKAEEPQAEQ